jgi:hypothetical protein
LQNLPARPDTFYIHDVALMPERRRSHLGTTVAQLLVHQAKLESLDNMSLVAVGRSLDFWRKNGFQAIERENIQAALSSYGEGSHVQGSNVAITNVGCNRTLRSQLRRAGGEIMRFGSRPDPSWSLPA